MSTQDNPSPEIVAAKDDFMRKLPACVRGSVASHMCHAFVQSWHPDRGVVADDLIDGLLLNADNKSMSQTTLALCCAAAMDPDGLRNAMRFYEWYVFNGPKAAKFAQLREATVGEVA